MAADEKLTLPPPVRFALPLKLIHEALLTIDQVHCDPVVTVVEPLPPPAATDCEAGEMEYEHEVP